MSNPDREYQRKVRAELAARATAELERRRNTDEFKEAVKRRIVSELHPKQREVLEALIAGNRFVALTCSRRAGKTHLIASLIVYRLIDAMFGQEVVFAAPTLARGKELIWQEICRLVEKYHLGWHMVGNTAKIRTQAGALFRITGLDNKKIIGKAARGGDTVAFLCDESQEFPHLLEQLLVAAGPALSQRRGWFIASGTPGPTKRGHWHKIAHGGDGFTPLHWDMTQNPKLGRPGEEILQEEMERNGWGPTHPTFLREYRGLWVEDHTLMVCEFSRAKNATTIVPGYDPPRFDENGKLVPSTWRHFIGVDYGFSPDPCAWVVGAAHPHQNLVAIVHVEKHERLTSDEIAAKTQELFTKYQARSIVGDSASGGATFIQDWNQRYGRLANVQMRHAEKHDKAGSIDVLNTELRTGRLLLLIPAAESLAVEMETLQWKDPEHSDILSGKDYPDHAFDACRYMLRAIRAFTAKAAKPEISPDEAARLARVERALREQSQRRR